MFHCFHLFFLRRTPPEVLRDHDHLLGCGQRVGVVVFLRVKPWDFTIEIKDLAMKIWDLIVKT